MREIGQVLREGRLALGLDISDISKKTCISVYYLNAMEEGKFHIIPRVFDKGYLKIYASVLQLEVKPILALYERLKKESAGNDRLIAPRTA